MKWLFLHVLYANDVYFFRTKNVRVSTNNTHSLAHLQLTSCLQSLIPLLCSQLAFDHCNLFCIQEKNYNLTQLISSINVCKYSWASVRTNRVDICERHMFGSKKKQWVSLCIMHDGTFSRWRKIIDNKTKFSEILWLYIPVSVLFWKKMFSPSSIKHETYTYLQSYNSYYRLNSYFAVTY